MNTKILASTLALAISTPVLAGESVNATVVHHYESVTVQTPQVRQNCRVEHVPIYGTVQQRGSTVDTLVGAAVGAAVGRQFGDGSGQDIATAAGAIVGGARAHQGNSTSGVVGYRQEQRCYDTTTYTTSTQRVYDYSTVTWFEDGKEVRLQYQR